MSSATQNLNKKSSSSNSSAVNTPASTPVTSIPNVSNSHTPVQSVTPPNNAPKYGTLVPNRIFVGGISASTTEAELLQLFSNYGTVKAAKIIQDRAGVSKGYGFITFESEEEAKRLQREADNIVLRERKLNIAPAIKKQPFSRAFDAGSPPTVAPGGPAQYFIPAGGVPFYQGGVAYYPQPAAPPGDLNPQQAPVYQSPAVYPAQSGPPQTATYPSIVYPAQPMYMPQQFPYQAVPYDFNYYSNGGPSYVVGGQAGPQPQVPAMQPPGSPPRAPCYTPQLSYNPDAMYYNMPMYGTMEGAPPMYQDSMDMANGGLVEDAYSISDASQELENYSSSSGSQYNIHPQNTYRQTSSDTTRKSNTPVVSLFDQHQEKDFMSMQSGRRNKASASTSSTGTNHNYLPNGYVNRNFVNSNLNSTPFPSGVLPCVPPMPPFDYMFGPKFMPHGVKSYPPPNGKRYNKYNGDWTDENRNEDKNRVGPTGTPPPVPYLPGNKYNTTRIYNNRVYRNGYYNFESNRNVSPSNSVNNGPAYKKILTSGPNTDSVSKINKEYTQTGGANNYSVSKEYTLLQNVFEDANKNVDSSASSNNKVSSVDGFECSDSASVLNCTNASQVSPAGPQHFVPPARRARRTVRRNVHSGAPLSEIGAGDAPIPAADVVDTCKKLDNLKL